MLSFNVNAWCAWAPGIETPAQWQQWQRDGELGEPQMPSLDWVSAAQRRRLSSLTRIQLACAKTVIGDDSLPVIFASRHGELHRTFQLLTTLGEQEPLSPTHFSLSVHNAAAGLFGILREDRAPANVVVGDDDSLMLGLVEACAMLGSGQCEEVLLVAGEQQVPAPYVQFMASRQVDHALALRLGRGSNIRLINDALGQAQPWPLAMQLAALLASGESGRLALAEQGWTWQR